LARYSDALLELELLRKEYADAGAGRGRSDVDTVAGESDVVDDSVYHQDGVPLQVVVIIALAVFITTYLFL
jgi:vesicle-associated membrane protein-associated protein A